MIYIFVNEKKSTFTCFIHIQQGAELYNYKRAREDSAAYIAIGLFAAREGIVVVVVVVGAPFTVKHNEILIRSGKLSNIV